MRHVQAFAAAIVVTGLVGLGMLLIGINAATNSNTVPVTDSPVDAAAALSAPSSDAQSAQLQNQLAQYQTQLNNAIKQLNQENAQIQQLQQQNAQLQQYQGLVMELQQRGIIRILSDGTVQLRSGR